VRRIAIGALPHNETSRTALLECDVLRDADAQVQLAAILALSDMPPSRQGAEALVALLTDGAGSDRWIADALTSAAAMHGVEFLQELARSFPRVPDGRRSLPAEASRLAGVLGEHLARGDQDASDLAALLNALADADGRLASTVIAAVAKHWPEDRAASLPRSAEGAIIRLLTHVSLDAKSDLLRLARQWHAGDMEELHQQQREMLRAQVANADLPDSERIFAAQAWVRLDPDDGSIVEELLGIITPQTSPSLLVGLLQAAAESRYDDFGADLVLLYDGLLPQGREAVLELLLQQPDSTNALLDAVAANEIDVAALRLEQIAALRAHPVETIRNRAAELIVAGGVNPNPDRQKVLADLLPVAEIAGDAAEGKKLFAKHCAVCHSHGGTGATVGPDLTGMFVHPKRDVLGNIIDPSRDVEGNFRSYSVIANGKVYAGLFAGESRTTITMVDSSGKRHVIQRSDVDEVFSNDKSLMPDGFEKQLSRTNLANVLEFLATPQRYVPLSLARVATASSAKPLFEGQADGPDRLVLPDWKPRIVGGVPFTLVDPQQGAVRNILLFRSDRTPLTRRMPETVRLPCGYQAKTLHLLSGVSGWGFPVESEETPSLIIRLHYQGGRTEEHELRNGVHFADYISRVDVPGSEFAFAMRDQQMRYLAIKPEREDQIVDIEFVTASDSTVPIVLAVTVELP